MAGSDEKYIPSTESNLCLTNPLDLPQDIATKINNLLRSFMSEEEGFLRAKSIRSISTTAAYNTYLRIQNYAPAFIKPQVFLDQVTILKG